MNTKAIQGGQPGAVSHTATMKSAMETGRGFDVHTVVGQLGENTVELHTLLNELSARLDPVTRPSNPTADIAEVRTGYSTPLAERINCQSYEVQFATMKVRDLLDRLEV